MAAIRQARHRALLQLDDGRDVGHALSERGRWSAMDDGEGIQRAAPAGLRPLGVAGEAERAYVARVEVCTGAGPTPPEP